jgi:serine/threonine protein kinase
VQGELPDGTEVAVRRLSLNSRQGKREFAKGVKNIIELQHRNVVKLIGCCYSNSRLLVYEYIGNGSVASALFGTSLHPYGRLCGFELLEAGDQIY